MEQAEFEALGPENQVANIAQLFQVSESKSVELSSNYISWFCGLYDPRKHPKTEITSAVTNSLRDKKLWKSLFVSPQANEILNQNIVALLRIYCQLGITFSIFLLFCC
jgi:hypothetical protein